jgi:hypothetical protein
VSKEENEFMRIVEGGGSEEDLRTLFESRLELSSNIMIWLMSSAIAIAILIAQFKIQFNIGDVWGLILFIAYLLIIAVGFPLIVRGRLRTFEKNRVDILKQYLEAKKLLQKTPKSH